MLSGTSLEVSVDGFKMMSNILSDCSAVIVSSLTGAFLSGTVTVSAGGQEQAQASARARSHVPRDPLFRKSALVQSRPRDDGNLSR